MALQPRVFVKYNGKDASKCAMRGVCGEALIYTAGLARFRASPAVFQRRLPADVPGAAVLSGSAVSGADVAGFSAPVPESGIGTGSVTDSVVACVVEGAAVAVAGFPVELSVAVPSPPPQEASSSNAANAAAPVVSSPAVRRLPLFLFRLIV